MKENNLDIKVIEELKGKLLTEKDRLEKELEGFAERNPDAKGDWKTKYVDIGSDWDENSQEVTEYDTNLSIGRALEGQLKQVNEALGRIDNETYGFCEVDGEAIPIERLRANPEARTCIDHSSQNAQ